MFTNKTKSRPETAPWERFCKDEARRAAHDFLEKVRRLQTIDQSSMEIPENVFATKFSAHFMDEVMDLTGAPNDMNVPGDFSRNKKSGTGKSWWNIFKRKQNSREDRGALTGSAANKNASNHSVAHGAATTTTTILEAQVKMLDMNKSSHELSWKTCRLVLTSEQGNHQLEIYCPPKVRERERVCVCVFVLQMCLHWHRNFKVVVGASHTPIYSSQLVPYEAVHTRTMLSTHCPKCHITCSGHSLCSYVCSYTGAVCIYTRTAVYFKYSYMYLLFSMSIICLWC